MALLFLDNKKAFEKKKDGVNKERTILSRKRETAITENEKKGRVVLPALFGTRESYF